MRCPSTPYVTSRRRSTGSFGSRRIGRGVSLNEAAVEAIRRGLGVVENEVVYDDLDDLAGTWQQDDEFDRAIEEQDRVDNDIWR